MVESIYRTFFTYKYLLEIWSICKGEHGFFARSRFPLMGFSCPRCTPWLHCRIVKRAYRPHGTELYSHSTCTRDLHLQSKKRGKTIHPKTPDISKRREGISRADIAASRKTNTRHPSLDPPGDNPPPHPLTCCRAGRRKSAPLTNGHRTAAEEGGERGETLSLGDQFNPFLCYTKSTV